MQNKGIAQKHAGTRKYTSFCVNSGTRKNAGTRKKMRVPENFRVDTRINRKPAP